MGGYKFGGRPMPSRERGDSLGFKQNKKRSKLPEMPPPPSMYAKECPLVLKGAEWRVKHAQTQERGPPSRVVFESCISALLQKFTKRDIN